MNARKSNIFNLVQMSKPNRNAFDLSNIHTTSMNAGYLIPIYWDEMVPGDLFRMSSETVVRLAPLVSPAMTQQWGYCHYFVVPKRLLWENFHKYYTNTPLNTMSDALPAFPTITVKADGTNYTPLMDYMGIPDPADMGADATTDVKVSALPFAAYNFIFNEYFRDENLVDELVYKCVDGANDATQLNLAIQKRAWGHDYFTSCLPFAQKGAAVDLPLGQVSLNPSSTNPVTIRQAANHALGSTGALDATNIGSILHAAGTNTDSVIDPNDTLIVDATTINDLRIAEALQKFLEKNARGGTRLTEMILAHFGVKTSDARLQRPEYIVGAKFPIRISEVLQTSSTDGTSPQGNMAGHGIGVNSNANIGGYFAEEPCIIMGIMSILPETQYFQGFEKKWLKINSPREEYYPELAHLGEQEVINDELYGYTVAGKQVFGYLPRYAEMRFTNNRISGEMRNSLLSWNQARKFIVQPALNDTFITSDPTTRIFAVTEETEDHYYVQHHSRVFAIRPLPKFANPTL